MKILIQKVGYIILMFHLKNPNMSQITFINNFLMCIKELTNKCYNLFPKIPVEVMELIFINVLT